MLKKTLAVYEDLLSTKKILIIKFGGLGDIILSLNAIYSIFNHHNKCKLILLTEEPYNKLLLKFELV